MFGPLQVVGFAETSVFRETQDSVRRRGFHLITTRDVERTQNGGGTLTNASVL